MRFPVLLCCLLTCALSEAQTPKPATGTLVRLNPIFSDYVQPRPVDVWLPPGYAAHRKYAVLYLHDGQMLFDSSITWNRQEWGVDETMGQLLNSGRIRDCIVVGIWNSGDTRHAEYFPEKPIRFLPDSSSRTLLPLLKNKPLADAYLRYLVYELKPLIDSSFATSPDRSATFIAGSSMGGLISLYALLEYPDVFGGAACLSTHWPGIFTANEAIPDVLAKYIAEHLPLPGNHRFYFDHGTESLDSLYPRYQQKVDTVMLQKGFKKNDWLTLVFRGDDHSETSWRRRLQIPLLFLLRK